MGIEEFLNNRDIQIVIGAIADIDMFLKNNNNYGPYERDFKEAIEELRDFNDPEYALMDAMIVYNASSPKERKKFLERIENDKKIPKEAKML